MEIVISVPDNAVRNLLAECLSSGATLRKLIERIVVEAVTENDEGESRAILQSVPKLDDDAAFEEAISLLEMMEPGRKVYMHDLFRAIWNKLQDGEKKQLGRNFRASVEKRGLAKWVRRGRNSSMYERL